MRIIINNRQAAIKKGTSFDYIYENSLFSDSEGYSLTITFPLRGCAQNLAIFGHINRADVSAKAVTFDCEIRGTHFTLAGIITITEINDAEVKTQFLNGKAEHNFNSAMDEAYINELDLGKKELNLYELEDIASNPLRAWTPEDTYINFEAVALPWVNDASGNLQNGVYYGEASIATTQKKYHWMTSTNPNKLSWQPYLLHITKKICEAIGYTYDFSVWEEDKKYRYLLICNSLPGAWDMPEYARALPRWTVKEYFEKLALFMRAEFTFDHRKKTVTFEPIASAQSRIAPVQLENIIDEHSVQIKETDNQCKFLINRNLVYKESDGTSWKFYSCDWFIKQRGHRYTTYQTVETLISNAKEFAIWDGTSSSAINTLYYVRDIDTYFVINPVHRYKNDAGQWQYNCVLQPVNALGGSNANSDEETETEELEFVPVRLDWTNFKKGKCMFLHFNGYEEQTTDESTEEDDEWKKTQPIHELETGETTGKPEYYDRIYIGWWDGEIRVNYGKLPHPFTDNVVVADDWSVAAYPPFSIRLKEETAWMTIGTPKIDPRRKVTFKFLSNTIPNPRAVFYIRGKRYICEKITATFTEDGMSKLLKGEFYPITED